MMVSLPLNPSYALRHQLRFVSFVASIVHRVDDIIEAPL